MRSLQKVAVSIVASALLIGRLDAQALAGADEVVIKRVSGSVGYLIDPQAKPVPVLGDQVLPPRDYALTQTRSMAALLMPDSSVVSLGSSTRVKVGEFLVSQNVSRMQIAIMGGALHFSILHPTGTHANYTFMTPTAQIAVRGTEGMIIVRPNETIVACVHGTIDDTLVTAMNGSRHYLPPGQTLRIRALGGHRAAMEMRNGIIAPGFGEFAALVKRNHEMRMKKTR